MATLYCLACSVALREQDYPDDPHQTITCPACGGRTFTTRLEWALTRSDLKFLRGLRIATT